MPRATLDNRGPRIAKPGYDANTAPLQHMLFDPQFVAARLYQQGTVALAEFGHDQYRSVYQPFAKTFPAPPVVLVAGIRSDGSSDITPWLSRNIPSSGIAQNWPYYSIVIGTSGFTLIVRRQYLTFVDGVQYWMGSDASTWRFWVLDNTLS